MKHKKKLAIPTKVDGTPVWADEPIGSETWIALIPRDPNDERVWEYNPITGRIVQFRFE